MFPSKSIVGTLMPVLPAYAAKILPIEPNPAEYIPAATLASCYSGLSLTCYLSLFSV
jgi:hypothetical protein